MKKYRSTELLFKLFLIICLFLTFISIVIHIRTNGIPFADHEWYWKECRYTLKGIDSGEAIKQQIYFEDIGEIPANCATLPWMKVIGVVVHGSFLPYSMSRIYYTILNIVILVISIAVINKKFLENYGNKTVAYWAIVSMFSSWYLVDWVVQGNNATMVCLLIIIGICILEEHPVYAGMLWGIAMIKPQIALPFFIIVLMKRKWSMIFTSVGVVLMSWCASVYITGTDAITQLSNTFSMSFSYDRSFWIYGIFNPLQKLGISSSVVMVLSMLLGIVVCFATGELYMKMQRKENTYRIFVIYVIPAIVSVFWCYKSQCDYNILIIVAIAVVEHWYNGKQRNQTYLLAMVAIMVFVMMKPLNLFNALAGLMGIWDRNEMIGTINYLDLCMKSIITLTFVIGVSLGEGCSWKMRRKRRYGESNQK